VRGGVVRASTDGSNIPHEPSPAVISASVVLAAGRGLLHAQSRHVAWVRLYWRLQRVEHYEIAAYTTARNLVTSAAMDRAAHTGLPRGLEEVPTAGPAAPRYWDMRIAVVIVAAPGAPPHAIEPSTKEHFSSSALQSNGHQRAPVAREGCVAKQTKCGGLLPVNLLRVGASAASFNTLATWGDESHCSDDHVGGNAGFVALGHRKPSE
jgi:hypothetical protein